MDFIPIIHFVIQVDYFNNYKNNCITIGGNTPLLTKNLWATLNTALISNEIYTFLSNSHRLSLREMLGDTKFQPEIYGMDSSTAEILRNAFGLGPLGQINPRMKMWWFIYEHSNDLSICRKFMLQRNFRL